MASENKKMKSCVSCGAEIAKSAKTCPQCGAKNKKPIYKRAWFIVVVVFIGVGVISSMGKSNSESTLTDEPAASTSVPASNSKTAEESIPEVIEYTAYDVKELVDDLEENALKAEKKYSDVYVELTGKLDNIDSDGQYISLTKMGDFAIQGVQCYIQNEEQLDKILEMKIGDTVVLKGQIQDIGEILGYTLDIDTIE